jgi:hypothetical protein
MNQRTFYQASLALPLLVPVAVRVLPDSVPFQSLQGYLIGSLVVAGPLYAIFACVMVLAVARVRGGRLHRLILLAPLLFAATFDAQRATAVAIGGDPLGSGFWFSLGVVTVLILLPIAYLYVALVEAIAWVGRRMGWITASVHPMVLSPPV